MDYVFDATPDQARKARTLLRYFLRRCRNKDDAFNLLLAVGEAINNCIEHAYKEQPGKFRLLGFVADCGDFKHLVIEVQDDGRWNMRKNYKRRQDPLSERGKGLQMMQALGDVTVYSRLRGGTVVRFCKRWDDI